MRQRQLEEARIFPAPLLAGMDTDFMAVMATHCVEGFERVRARKCVRIRSQLKIQLPWDKTREAIRDAMGEFAPQGNILLALGKIRDDTGDFVQEVYLVPIDEKIREGTREFVHEWTELYVELPAADVQLWVADPWRSDMRVLPVPQSETEVRVVRAKHRVEDFEWIAGHKCVRIRSEYKVDGEKIKLKLKAKAEQAAVFGGEMGAFPEDEMMAPMEEMGMEGEMGMGMEGEAKVSDEIETSYVGERLTYFAYEMNRPVKIVDIITHSLEVPRGAVGTMGMEEGMMEGEMMPEFAEEPPGGPGEGMPAGDEGFAEFGGFGGGFQTQPATPMKINVNVRLEISEVGF